ncbi:MAG: hypothetical protein RLZZ77_81 [Bacteroidota bacterium]
MRTLRLLEIGIVLSSLIGYLQWGGNQSAFLFETEWLILSQLFIRPTDFAHPFILLPLLGQVLLIIHLFLAKTNKRLLYACIGALSTIMLMILLVGMMSLRGPIILSSLPFFFLCFWLIRTLRKNPSSAQ